MARETPRVTLIATLTAQSDIESAAGLPAEAWIEVRADLVGDLDPEALRAALPGRVLLYTLRSRAEGGAWDGSPERRKRRILDAAPRYDRVDLEAARDLAPEILAAVAPENRILSWHGPNVPLVGLQSTFKRMSATPAALYKLVPTAVQPGDELAPLLLLHGLERSDVAAFAVGVGGAWTRLIAPRLGAPFVFGAAGALPGAPGQWTMRRLVEDFGLPELAPIQALFGVVGNPATHSLSPRLHNAAYRALGLPALYVPFETESFADFWLEVVESGLLEEIGFPLRGLSVTAPFKETALAVSGAESPRAGRIGAANTLIWNEGVWEAEATDPDGVIAPLRARGVAVEGKEAVVVGTGGAGRSAAVGLASAGARVTLANRGAERGLEAAGLLELPFLPLADLDPSRYDILVNATSLGRQESDPPPFAVEAVRPGAVVIDMVYSEEPTALLRAAAERGAIAIDGREVLLGQALRQFRMMTGREMPLDVARRALGLETPA